MPLLRHDEIIGKKQKLMPKLWKTATAKLTNTKRLPWSHLNFLIGWFLFQHGRNEGYSKGGWGKAQNIRTWAEVHSAPVEFPPPADTPAPTKPGAPATEEATPTQDKIEQWREEVKKLEWVGRSPEPSPSDGWLRWPPKWGHWCQLGRSQPRRNSGWLWEARSPENSFSRLGSWRSPRGTGWGL